MLMLSPAFAQYGGGCQSTCGTKAYNASVPSYSNYGNYDSYGNSSGSHRGYRATPTYNTGHRSSYSARTYAPVGNYATPSRNYATVTHKPTGYYETRTEKVWIPGRHAYQLSPCGGYRQVLQPGHWVQQNRQVWVENDHHRDYQHAGTRPGYRSGYAHSGLYRH